MRKKSRDDHLFQEKLSLKNYSAMDDFLFLKLCKIEDFAQFRKTIIYEDDPKDNTKIIKTRKDFKNNLKHQYIGFIDEKTTHEQRKEIVKMGDEGLKASMKNLELAFQNGAFDEFFKIKLDEMHHENVLKEMKK